MTLAYILDHAVCCASAASSGRSLHLIISQLRTKCSSSNCPNHVRRTMSSLKKRSKVRRILRTMFGEANVRPIKNRLYTESSSEEVSYTRFFDSDIFSQLKGVLDAFRTYVCTKTSAAIARLLIYLLNTATVSKIGSPQKRGPNHARCYRVAETKSFA